jgi:hypothetical protein
MLESFDKLAILAVVNVALEGAKAGRDPHIGAQDRPKIPPADHVREARDQVREGIPIGAGRQAFRGDVSGSMRE